MYAILHYSSRGKRLATATCTQAASALQLYYILLYFIMLCCTILYYTMIYYTILYHIILYCTILYYTILYYTILYYSGRGTTEAGAGDLRACSLSLELDERVVEGVSRLEVAEDLAREDRAWQCNAMQYAVI